MMETRSDSKPDEDSLEFGFSQSAMRPGGVPRNRAIEKAEAELKRIGPALNEFVERGCAELALALAAAEVADAEQAANIAKAHLGSEQIRDVAETANLPLVGHIAKSLCEIFEVYEERVIDYPQAVVGCHFDALRLAQLRQYKQKTPAELPELTQGLRDAVDIVRRKGAKAKARKKPVSAPAPATVN
jgi:hypothetical protein